MAIDFPAAPNPGDIYTDPTSGNSWTWDGVKWNSIFSDTAIWERTGTVISALNAGDQLNLDGTAYGDPRTITAGAFDLSTGNFWQCGAITVPNPTNAVAGTSGLIVLTGAPTGWGANFDFPGGTPPTVTTVPAVTPFYVQDPNTILMGNVVEGIS